MKTLLIVALLMLVLVLTAGAPVAAPPPGGESAAASSVGVSGHTAAIVDWRRRRHERLTSDSGWLTLVGLDWLQQGANRVGSAAGNDIRLPGGPAEWGTVMLEGEGITFLPAAGAGITVDGSPAVTRVRLLADDQGEPTVVAGGTLSFHVISRGSYALRVKDKQAPTRLAFSGIETYPIDAGWRFDARFIPAEPGRSIEIGDVLGHITPMPVLGTVEFERDGRTHRLIGLAEAGVDSLWFLFADRTTGRETYGAGRFLYSDGMPQNGRVVVDFNKAYNPPCAFTDYSTCPLPPQENRLDIAVTAGEMDYRHD